MKKKILKVIAWTVGIVVSLLLGIWIAFQVSPKPSAMIIARLFNGEVKISDEKTYDLAKKNVSVILNQTYQSKFKDNTYDVYYPKQSTTPVPVLLWVHGGGYVGGDKEGAKEFATRLASDANIAVVSMNYGVAPELKYPNQVIQVADMMQTLKKKQDKHLDISKMLIGGDSAGSQIALQFVNTQTNRTYGEKVGIPKILDDKSIKGTISYCGPVDLIQMADKSVSDKKMKFFVKTVAWSLIGTKNWQSSDELVQASLVDQVTANFPPTYITDGNAFSFEAQNIALANKLKALKVPVTSLFYTNKKKQITHEYQFNYKTEEAKLCYEQTLNFVNQYK